MQSSCAVGGKRAGLEVLVLSNLYPSTTQPLRGLFNQQRFHALSQHCALRVVVPRPWWTAPASRGAAALPGDPLSVRYPVYWSLPSVTSWHARGMALSLRRLFARLDRERRVDAILSAWAYPDMAAAVHLGSRLSIPVVGLVMGSDINHLCTVPPLRRQIVDALQQTAGVVAVSDALGGRLVELGVPPERITVQRNGVDGARFQPVTQAEARNRLGLPSRGELIGYVGNLSQEKGPLVLLEAFELLCSERPEASLVYVGGGRLQAELSRLADATPARTRVQVLGPRPHQEIPTWLAAFDVLCLPSFREGCPNVVLESKACGRPVVASRVGGVPEILDEDSGVLVPPGDPLALAAGLRRALDQVWDAGSIRRSVADMTWSAFGTRLYEVLLRAVAATPGGRR